MQFEEILADQHDPRVEYDQPHKDPYADYVIHPRGDCEGRVDVRPDKALKLEQYHMDCTDSVSIQKVDKNCCYGEACRTVYCRGEAVCLTEKNPMVFLTDPGTYIIKRVAGDGATPKIRKTR